MRRSVEEERASLHTAMGRMYEDYDELSELLDDLLRAHAHELAEQVRAAYSREGPDEDNWIMNPYDAAHLIDPEVA